MTTRRLAYLLAIVTTAVLVAMVLVSIVTGATQEAHEHWAPKDEYVARLLVHGSGLRTLMGLDLAFLVLYTALFTALSKYLAELGRPFVRLALGFMISTAVLDIVEDYQIITALDLAHRGVLVSDTWIALQQILSGTKFAVSYLGLFLFGLAIPRARMLGTVLAVFLTVGTLATAVLAIGAPPELRAGFDSTRWISFLVGFTILALWLRTEPDPK
jgi:hypothetical protein